MQPRDARRALLQVDLKRLLAYSSIAHAGYLLMALETGTPKGREAALFYLFVYAFMTIGAFAIVIALGGRDDLHALRQEALATTLQKIVLKLDPELTVDDLKPILDHVLEFGADHLNVQPDVRPYTLRECFPLIDGWRRLAADAGVKMQIETHRNRMTTDLLFTLHLLDHYPDLRLTGDLSHYVLGREFWYPVTDEDNALMHRIIDNCWGFHGRVASREQIQLQLNFPQHQGWVQVFMGWWERGFRQWQAKAGVDETLTFLCELGPAEYAMTGPDGYELSDRWQESIQMMGMVRGLWQRISS